MGPISPRRLCRWGRIGANIGVRSAIDLARCPFGLERGAEALRGRVVPSCLRFAFDLYGSLGLELHAFRLGQRSKSVKMFCRSPPPWSRTTLRRAKRTTCFAQSPRDPSTVLRQLGDLIPAAAAGIGRAVIDLIFSIAKREVRARSWNQQSCHNQEASAGWAGTVK